MKCLRAVWKFGMIVSVAKLKNAAWFQIGALISQGFDTQSLRVQSLTGGYGENVWNIFCFVKRALLDNWYQSCLRKMGTYVEGMFHEEPCIFWR